MINRDFTLTEYKKLVKVFLKAGYIPQTVEQFIIEPKRKSVVLRHDVDKRPENSLKMAKLENKLGIQASYYFRIVKQSNNPKIIDKVAALGHEIGYHYEDLTLAKGDYDNAIISFEKNLVYFRQFYPINTICMHGSPLSKYNNRLIWEKIDYKNYRIIGEPYFNIDFNNVAYLTETGGKWNASSENIRDKVKTNFAFDFKSTFGFIDAIEKKELPDNVMMNVHPQRWNENIAQWFIELLGQSCKNVIKKLINPR